MVLGFLFGIVRKEERGELVALIDTAESGRLLAELFSPSLRL